MIVDPRMAERMLRALGERLAAKSFRISLVVVGGTAMNLGGFVSRATRDVDVLARLDDGGLSSPDPLPALLRQAIDAVALDFGQDDDWMNTAFAPQLRTGLPPGLETRLTWLEYDTLRVGLVGRLDLIAFKLYASADQTGPDSVHCDDLLALAPVPSELTWAADWIRTQDASTEFHAVVQKVIDYVLRPR